MTPKLSSPPVAAAAPPRGFAALKEGAAAPWEGLRYLMRHPALWRYAIWPVLLNVLITGFVLVLLLAAAAAFAWYLHPYFPEGWTGIALEVLSFLGLLLAAIGLALVLWLLLHGILTGHFYTRLARAVELQLGTPAELLRDVPWSYQAIDAVRDAAALIGVNGALLLLNVVPIIGPVLGFAGGLYFDSWIFGAEYLDFPLALRGLRRDAKRAFLRRHREHVLGLGLVALVCMLVPVVGSVLLASAAVGAVLLHHRLAPDAVAAPPV